MIRSSLWAAALCWTLITAFSGCRSLTQPVTYYTLSPISGQAADTGGAGAVTIGVRTVELPGYINRTEMVTRSGPHRLEVSSLHRWADYPDRLVQQVLGENLQALLPGASVVNSPWPVGLKPDITLFFQFKELMATGDGKMLLRAVWTVRKGDPPFTAQSHRAVLTESVPGPGFDQLAAAHSRVLESLCRMVAESLPPMDIQP